jgi:hypothetical protein
MNQPKKQEAMVFLEFFVRRSGGYNVIKGRKHIWCGKVNWEGKDVCHTCKPWGSVPKEMYHFEDVIFDNPKLEKLAEQCKEMSARLRIPVTLDYDNNQDNEAGETVGALIIDGWLTVYPEKLEKEGILGKEMIDGWAIDVATPVYNYPNEPDDVDITREGTYEYWLTVLCKVFKIIFSQHLDNIAEGMQYKEQAETDIPF